MRARPSDMQRGRAMCCCPTSREQTWPHIRSPSPVSFSLSTPPPVAPAPEAVEPRRILLEERASCQSRPAHRGGEARQSLTVRLDELCRSVSPSHGCHDLEGSAYGQRSDTNSIKGGVVIMLPTERRAGGQGKRGERRKTTTEKMNSI